MERDLGWNQWIELAGFCRGMQWHFSWGDKQRCSSKCNFDINHDELFCSTSTN